MLAPDAAARTLLRVIWMEPEAVQRVVAGELRRETGNRIGHVSCKQCLDSLPRLRSAKSRSESRIHGQERIADLWRMPNTVTQIFVRVYPALLEAMLCCCSPRVTPLTEYYARASDQSKIWVVQVISVSRNSCEYLFMGNSPP